MKNKNNNRKASSKVRSVIFLIVLVILAMFMFANAEALNEATKGESTGVAENARPSI